jgi:hypothetical protein
MLGFLAEIALMSLPFSRRKKQLLMLAFLALPLLKRTLLYLKHSKLNSKQSRAQFFDALFDELTGKKP